MTPLEGAIRAGCAAREPIPCPQDNVPGACPSECPYARTVIAALTHLHDNPTEAEIEAVARAIWKARSTRDWFEIEPEEMAHWQTVANAAHKALFDSILGDIGGG